MAMERKKVVLPLSDQQVKMLRAGELLSLSGTLYTARDAAHKRMDEALKSGRPLPFDLTGQTLYYVGPCPAGPGQVIGSAGPTTSGRMDRYTPLLLEHGLRAMIGKGYRQTAVIDAMKRYGAVYFGATGGAGALLASHIVASEVVAWPDLGTEAVRRLTVQDFPVVVLIDAEGRNLYTLGRAKYQKKAAIREDCREKNV